MQIVEMKHYIINLTKNEREELVRLTTTGRRSALKMLHARILLKTDEGLLDEEIAEHLDVNVWTVERVRKRCALEGINAALSPKKRPLKVPKFDGETEARLVQLACSEAPNGRQRWTLRFSNLDAFGNIDGVVAEILRHLEKELGERKTKSP